MIRGFEPPHPADPVGNDQVQWGPALGAGLIAGVILLVVPNGNPWGGLTSFSPAILGRAIPNEWNVPAFAAVVLQLSLSLLYGIIISFCVIKVRNIRAVLLGGIMGLVLYLFNFAIVSIWFRELRGSEVSVFVTHAVFGLIAAGAYRGLLRRKVAWAAGQGEGRPG